MPSTRGPTWVRYHIYIYICTANHHHYNAREKIVLAARNNYTLLRRFAVNTYTSYTVLDLAKLKKGDSIYLFTLKKKGPQNFLSLIIIMQ
jgi:hypothetical protein